MVSHRNKKLLLEKSGQKIHKFGLKKLKVGVVSVAITAGILVSHNTLPQVNAEELVDENAVELVTDEVAEELPEVEASVEEGIVEEKPSEESTVELVSDAAVEELPEVESPTEASVEEGIVEE
ncbi:YSIRK-type signal peptide-containing protein, partial [Aerococcus urinaeequi]